MAENKMRELVDRLNEASDAYYNGKREMMTDYEWDHLFDQLRQMERETGITLADSPTNHVSADEINGQKEAHEFPALSLAKTKKTEDLVKWAGGKPVWLSWKLDGLTLVVTFDGGHLTKVVTRGNGHIGTNITHLAQSIGGIPQNIPYKGHAVIRGECVISYNDFERFLLESDEDYANPRNLASGSLTLKDPLEVKQRHLQWIPFTLVYTEEELPHWGDRMNQIEKNGMKAVDREYIQSPTRENMDEAIRRWTHKVTNRENPYPVDGLVIAYDDWAYSQTGSVTGHHATRAGLAFKWQDENARTVLNHIEWSCATSTISPVAVFEPVNLEGTTVKRASLCNISECERLGIGGKGTVIRVIKANKIIPKVIQVDKKVGELTIPDRCPVCGAPTKIVISESSNTKTLHCTNQKCPAKQLKKFARFVSKDGMDIDGISEQTLDKFINRGWVNEYADLYHLKDHIEEIANMDGFGDKSAMNIRQSIEHSQKVEARHLLYALSIPLCGKDVCNRLLSTYPIEELVKEAAAENVQDDHFALIPGIGPEKSAQIVKWFQDKDNKAKFDRLWNLLDVSQDNGKPKGERCQGLTFVITGNVYHYKNRNELKAYIESQGGKATGSVSKSTSYLINNDITSTSGKNQKAHQLGVEVISEDEFIRRFASEH
ncbi:MAG: NAD-dependent DNA ligase LigA [Prevotella sp.]|nr:NAD-dependent DNA ligase LigA [Prevotella sp.]MCH3985166.1 NAD-dependent DNA ligase LigA [Prevotella sp.]MCI1685051.1 NAD-dependent DNA ligase LigA [Prevotella sp.]MCI1803422.1 NAD-dependent DNA ligase LigA [Prevotella sp.]MCI1815828.1 NAD-dependent DNA ligase LigA [Prevotella sp.]MCI1849201.1 NAD-dependent DNA ligase LigA [Prevotella sp.]